jgi:hypothetical protein
MLLEDVSILPGDPKLKEEEVRKNFALLLLSVKWLLS